MLQVLPGGEVLAGVRLHADGPVLMLMDGDLAGTLRATLGLPPTLPGLTMYERYLLGLPDNASLHAQQFEIWITDVSKATLALGMPLGITNDHWDWFRARFDEGHTIDSVLRLARTVGLF